MRRTLVDLLARDIARDDETGPDWLHEVETACERQDMEWELDVWDETSSALYGVVVKTPMTAAITAMKNTTSTRAPTSRQANGNGVGGSGPVGGGSGGVVTASSVAMPVRDRPQPFG